MSRARVRALALFSAMLIAAGIAAAVIGREPRPLPPRPLAARPPLLLLTSLPLIFPEDFSLHGGGSAALTALGKRYRVAPISATDPAELARGRLLLMAHPQVQTAENLVALDGWVSGGGRVLLLADPLLEWPSRRPLGDPLRPAPMFADTGLLAHWGVRLDVPAKRGPIGGKLGGYAVLADSPGSLSGRCAISADALVAHCRIGRGRATIVADADFLDADRLGSEARHNLDALLAELAALEKP
jgi:hypothetical protein